MNPTTEDALFTLLRAKPAAEHAAFLERECGNDKDLRQRLEARLAAQDPPDGSRATTDATAEATVKVDVAGAQDESVGTSLGHYKLLERVGEGGCGVVYVAEQTEPVRRRVALKVIKLGMDTKQVVARFEAERQALAMMDHPNIAKVLDAGTTSTGRPYFVMELVRGIPITTYCDQSKLSTPERLDLFIKVCQAIQHAHQKGIIHRDIKPSNILVTLHDGVPVPKVIDFGIAKATEGRLTDSTVYTQLHQFIGTPAYMSPEQAEMSGLDIDTRSDIYSLGVLLYELLAGITPFDARELVASGIDTMRKTIREQEPLRPSTKLATLEGELLTTTAKRRSADTSRLLHQLRGDLDWIVMKCLEKDRTRRYETANGLAADLKRHLAHEPIVARPPSSAYRFQKAFRRNKLVFTAGIAVVAALCLGVIATTLQSVRATRAKSEALKAKTVAVAAEAEQARLRKQAQTAELAARRRAYAADMNIAAQALEGNNLGRALDVLNRQRPESGQLDLRGWEWRYLWGQTRSDARFTLCQEPAEINSLATSPDGQWLAVASYHAGGVALWDLRTRQEVARLAESELSSKAAFSPTEPLLALTSMVTPTQRELQSTLRLYDTATRRMRASLPLDTICLGLTFSEDGKTLATFTRENQEDGSITLWRMPDGKQVARHKVLAYQGPQRLGSCFAISPDMSLAAYASGAMPEVRIVLLDLRTGEEVWTCSPTEEFVISLAFSPDGKRLAVGEGFARRDIQLWDVASGKKLRQLEGHGSWVSSLAFLPDGRRLASSSADQTLRLWDLDSGACLKVLRGHRQEVWQLTILPDGDTLASGAKDGTVSIWDTASTRPYRPRTAFGNDVLHWDFAADGESVLTFDRQLQVKRWKAPNFQRSETLLDIGADVFRVALSEGGNFLTSTHTNGMIRLWDLTGGTLVRELSLPPDKIYPLRLGAAGQTLFAATDSDMRMRKLDFRTGLATRSWPFPPTLAGALAISPDDELFLAIGYEGDVVLRNLVTQSNVNVNLDILEAVRADFSPDGDHLAAASKLGFTRVWETATWQPVATVGGFLHGVNAAHFSPDASRLLIGSDGAEAVHLCETDSWARVFNLAAPGTGASIAFSPDGNYVVWGNQTGSLHAWRAPSWKEIEAEETRTEAGKR